MKRGRTQKWEMPREIMDRLSRSGDDLTAMIATAAKESRGLDPAFAYLKGYVAGMNAIVNVVK